MKRRSWAMMAFALMMVISLAGCGKVVSVGTDGKALEQGDAAPDFTAELYGGEAFTLSGQKGKVVLLNFWATWCDPCVGEMPAFEQLKEDYGDSVVILAVNYSEDRKTVDKFVKKEGYTFAIAYDTDGSIAAKYPTRGIPYTLVIGADGTIQKIYTGAADADTQYKEYRSAIEDVK